MTLATSIVRWRKPIIVLGHALLITVAYATAYLLRFDLNVPSDHVNLFLRTLPLLLAIRLIVFSRYKLYEGMWRFVSLRDMAHILAATTLSTLIFMAFGVVAAFFGQGFPRSIYVIDWLLCFVLVGGIRLAIRSAREFVSLSEKQGGEADGQMMSRVLIVGAGEAADRLIRSVHQTPTLHYDIVGMVDDDARKQGRSIHGVRVVGSVDQVPTLVNSLEVQELLIAIPAASGEERRRIIERCRPANLPIKTVPTLDQLFSGRAAIGQLQDVNPEDLLGRSPIAVDLKKISGEITGKTVLVTGAGGSIGSELARQVASFDPHTLLLYERAESNLYFVNLELRQRHPDLRIIPVIGDILDEHKVQEVMNEHKPAVVYHAAAYKHVPLMEDHPIDAIANNVIGTATVAKAAREAGVGKFVLISTDKAVKPVSVMGMTKRVAESVLLELGGGPTTFVAVRFGNVLGSDGSVLPLFRWQMASGSALTVTHAEATRYFMLISEAVQLVMQAGAMGDDGDMFFLDMGEPVKIMNLAEDLIRLSGLKPHEDVPVEVIGLRPGERLTEELLVETETLQQSAHEKIFLAQKVGFAREAFREDLEALKWNVFQKDQKSALERLRGMASRY